MTEFTEIPAHDLAPLINGGNTTQLAADFAKTYGNNGFGYVINHGVDPDLHAAVFAASKQCHNLPDAERQALALNATHLGYIAINNSINVNSDLAEVTKPNQTESFMMMREDAKADPDVYLSGANQWLRLPRFLDTCEAYAKAMAGLRRPLMGLALDAVGITDKSVPSAFDTPTIWLRLLR